MALSADQLAAIQQAAQAGGTGAGQHQTATGIFGDEYNSLVNSGLFNPADLSGVQSQNPGANGAWGNGAAPVSDWDSQLQQILGQAGQLQAAIPATDPSTPNQQAIAGGYNPLQPAYLPQPGQLNATTVQPSYLSPQLMNSLGSGQTIQALQNSVAPQYNQQDQQMMQMLATAGVAPSSTAGGTAFNNLAQQQLAGISPAMASAIQNSQANQLNAGQYNASTGNTASTYNANAQNNAAATNLANQNAQQQYNASAYNNAGQQYFNAETGQYNNNANAFNALNTAGLNGTQNLSGQQASGANGLAQGAQNEFPVYGSNSNPYGALGGALGGSAYGGGQSSVSPIQGGAGLYGGTAGQDASYWGSGGG